MLRYLFKDFVCSICMWLSGMGDGGWGGGGKEPGKGLLFCF